MLIVAWIVGFLAVARLTELLVEDRITVGYRRWVVKRWGGESYPSYLVHCPWCTSVWVSIPVMSVVTLWPNRWVIGAAAILAASYVTGFLADVRGGRN